MVKSLPVLLHGGRKKLVPAVPVFALVPAGPAHRRSVEGTVVAGLVSVAALTTKMFFFVGVTAKLT